MDDKQLKHGSQHKRSAGAGGGRMSPGPYIAKVISHLDTKRQGSLKVQLLTDAISGNDKKQDGQLFTVRYCMPFYGVTNVESNQKNNDYYSSQQSYGFWAVPPDPGTKVMVIFAEGLPNQGYWIGCIQDEYMNFQVPGGYPSDKGDNIIQNTVPNDFKNLPLPVGEFNKKLRDSKKSNNPDRFPRPHNPMMTAVLGKQGLQEDMIRGLTSTSSRRDLPNTVYGWNTPGPLDKQAGRPKGKYGEAGAEKDVYRSRLGGSAFTMDDGDPTLLREGPATQVGAVYYDIETTPKNVSKADVTLPFNEHIKLKTRTGHQILLHNTEDLIYIGNANGSTWIELTGNGKIDVYAQDSINIRTETDLNITADRDINIQSGRDTNITTGRDFKHRVNQDSDVSVAKDSKEFVGADRDVWVGALNTRAVGEDEDVQIKGTQRTTINGDYNLQVSKDGHIAINANFHSKVVGDYRQTVNGAFNLNTLGENKLTSYQSTQIRSFLNNKFDANTGNTEIKSGINHLETAGNHIHMNSTIPATSADTADVIGDTFTKVATGNSLDDADEVRDKDNQVINDADGNPLRVTADAARADEALIALRPRRIPRHEPWEGHENYNPTGHTPGTTASIEAPAPEVRILSPLIDKAGDQPEYNDTSGIYNAQDPYIKNAEGKTVREEIEVVASKDTDRDGEQPADPVPVIEQQRYFLSELIKGLGLPAATCLNSANPADLAPGEVPGNAQALAMAMAQIQKECAFEPKSENMRYSAERLIAVWPNRFGSATGRRKARELAAAGPAAIANSVYGNRMGNGPATTGDGYRYRGRGLIQITGKSNYKTYGGKAGVDIIKNPALANDPIGATKIAVAYLKSKSVSWDSFNFNSLGSEFQKAVGYAGGQANTNSRIKLGKGFYQRISNGELTPLASVTPPTPIDNGNGTSKVQ
tara:strand:- start:11304 stop:14084 length:2781 start_codon:yes stop_codon:yes gene_type:complete